MGLRDVPRHDSNDPPVPGEDPEWEAALAEAFPHAPGSRLARAAGINLRLAQRWSAIEARPSQRVRQFVIDQNELRRRLATTPALQQLVQSWIDAGLDKEVIASQLAWMHELVSGRTVE